MKIDQVETDLGKIEFCSVGKGTPIIFIHGGHSNCREVLSHKGINLEEFHLITPSRPGYGSTPLGDNKNVEKTAQLIIKLLDSLDLDRAIVYGISAGGLTAIELASKYPKRVIKLILASAVTKKWLEKNDPTYITAKKIFNPKIEWFIWNVIKLISYIAPRFLAKMFHPQFSSKKVDSISQKSVQDLSQALRLYRSKKGFVNDIDQDVPIDVIIKIQCPTLIIHSKNDTSVPIEHAKYASQNIETSKLVVLDNDWGHLFWIGKDAMKSIKEINEFINN